MSDLLTFTLYMLGVIGFMVTFLSTADKGEGVYAVGIAILWPLFMIVAIIFVVREEIINGFNL